MTKDQPIEPTICSECEQTGWDQCESCFRWGCSECEYRDRGANESVVCRECERKIWDEIQEKDMERAQQKALDASFFDHGPTMGCDCAECN